MRSHALTLLLKDACALVLPRLYGRLRSKEVLEQVAEDQPGGYEGPPLISISKSNDTSDDDVCNTGNSNNKDNKMQRPPPERLDAGTQRALNFEQLPVLLMCLHFGVMNRSVLSTGSTGLGSCAGSKPCRCAKQDILLVQCR